MEEMKKFGSQVFGLKEMQEALPKDVFSKFTKIVKDEEVLDKNTADAIAHAMKAWALSKGCTH